MLDEATHPGREAIEAEQLAKLRGLAGELLETNAFYAPRLRAANLTTVETLRDFRERMPFTTKSRIVADQQDHPPYGTNLTYPLERYTRLHQTSATTGTPLRWLDTPESWDWMLDHWRRVFEAAGVGAGDRVFFAFTFGPFLGFWLAFESAARMGCLCLPGGGLSSAARLRVMLDNTATVLCCTPTYAMRLAEVAAQERIDLSRGRVRVILLAGEPGGSVPAVRERIERAWPGARAYDHHGMTEVGPVSVPCPMRRDVLHVMESAYLPEVVDPAGGAPVAPVAPVAVGELVLTTLGRTGSPLLRYRTGDLVRTEPPGRCACGRCDLTLVGGILGRADDMVPVRGVNLYPSAVDQVLRAFDGVAEYRVEIRTERSMSEANVIVEAAPSVNDGTALAGRIEQALRDAFSLRIPVSVVAPGSLPRSEMKANRWVRV